MFAALFVIKIPSLSVIAQVTASTSSSVAIVFWGQLGSSACFATSILIFTTPAQTGALKSTITLFLKSNTIVYRSIKLK